MKVDKNFSLCLESYRCEGKRVFKMLRWDYVIIRCEDIINYMVKDVEEVDEDEVFDIGDDLEVDLFGLMDMDGIR